MSALDTINDQWVIFPRFGVQAVEHFRIELAGPRPQELERKRILCEEKVSPTCYHMVRQHLP